MAVSAAMRRATQVALEATPGAGGTVDKRFSSFGLEPSMNIQTGQVTPMGQTAPTAGWIAYEDSAFSVEGGILDYREVDYALQSAVKKVTATTPVGATDARQRVYTVSQFASDPFQTYKIEVGDSGGVNRGQTALNCAFDSWGFEVSSGDTVVAMSGSLLGGALADGTMTTSGVTQLDSLPVLPQHVTLKYAATFAGLSAGTEITNDFTCSFNITDRRALYRFLGLADGSASGTVETTPGFEFELTLADETAPVDTWMTNARAGTKQFFRVEFTGPEIEEDFDNIFRLDIACVLGDGPSGGEEQDVWARTFPYTAAYDGVSGKILEITTINGNATL